MAMALALVATAIVGAAVALISVNSTKEAADAKNKTDLQIAQLEAGNRSKEIDNQFKMDQSMLKFSEQVHKDMQGMMAETKRTIEVATKITQDSMNKIASGSGSFLAQLSPAQKNQVLNGNAYSLPEPARATTQVPLSRTVKA